MSPTTAQWTYLVAQAIAIGLGAAAACIGFFIYRAQTHLGMRLPLLLLVGVAIAITALAPFAMQRYSGMHFEAAAENMDCSSGIRFLEPYTTTSDADWCVEFLDSISVAKRLKYTYGAYSSQWKFQLGDEEVFLLRKDRSASHEYYVADLSSGAEWRFLHIYTPSLTELLKQSRLLDE
jgi:hypothetical protein